MVAVYDEIGRGYIQTRSADPRIAAAIASQIGSSRKLLNIGAGAGSYEPEGRSVLAVEPSMAMISQRPANAAPVIQARAEMLPFRNGSFDLAMGILTVHHWTDLERGLNEAARAANGNVLLLTWFESIQRYWLEDYFPDMPRFDYARFPPVERYREILGDIDLVEVPIPQDCTDGFLCAYWKRPEAYLDPVVRNGISTFSVIGNLQSGLNRLQSDLETGKWAEKYGDLLSRESYDCGYRLVRTQG